MVAKSLLIGLICLGMTTSAGRKEVPVVAAPNATSEIAALQPEYGRPFP
jgi:2-keto-3-deoxy-galactonokinase